MGELHLKECLIYLDDIIIFSKTEDEHIKRLESVFRRLKEQNLKLKGKKCEFFKTEIKYLGIIVSDGGIATDPHKVSVVKNWPVIKNVKDLRKFLGFTSYYRRFIQDYAKIVKWLNDLLIGHTTIKRKTKVKSNKVPTKLSWNEDQQKAMDQVIEKLTSPPILAYADYTLPFILHTDASNEG